MKWSCVGEEHHSLVLMSKMLRRRSSYGVMLSEAISEVSFLFADILPRILFKFKISADYLVVQFT